MRFILNIGLDPKATPEIAAHVAREILRANGFFTVGNSRIVQSDTEPTLVVGVTPQPGILVRSAIHQTAVDLGQECIAVWELLPRYGSLIGPGAAKWGAFDPHLFFMLDGRRLSEHLPQEA